MKKQHKQQTGTIFFDKNENQIKIKIGNKVYDLEDGRVYDIMFQ